MFSYITSGNKLLRGAFGCKMFFARFSSSHRPATGPLGALCPVLTKKTEKKAVQTMGAYTHVCVALSMRGVGPHRRGARWMMRLHARPRWRVSGLLLNLGLGGFLTLVGL